MTERAHEHREPLELTEEVISEAERLFFEIFLEQETVIRQNLSDLLRGVTDFRQISAEKLNRLAVGIRSTSKVKSAAMIPDRRLVQFMQIVNEEADDTIIKILKILGLSDPGSLTFFEVLKRGLGIFEDDTVWENLQKNIPDTILHPDLDRSDRNRALRETLRMNLNYLATLLRDFNKFCLGFAQVTAPGTVFPANGDATTPGRSGHTIPRGPNFSAFEAGGGAQPSHTVPEGPAPFVFDGGEGAEPGHTVQGEPAPFALDGGEGVAAEGTGKENPREVVATQIVDVGDGQEIISGIPIIDVPEGPVIPSPPLAARKKTGTVAQLLKKAAEKGREFLNEKGPDISGAVETITQKVKNHVGTILTAAALATATAGVVHHNDQKDIAAFVNETDANAKKLDMNTAPLGKHFLEIIGNNFQKTLESKIVTDRIKIRNTSLVFEPGEFGADPAIIGKEMELKKKQNKPARETFDLKLIDLPNVYSDGAYHEGRVGVISQTGKEGFIVKTPQKIAHSEKKHEDVYLMVLFDRNEIRVTPVAIDEENKTSPLQGKRLHHSQERYSLSSEQGRRLAAVHKKIQNVSGSYENMAQFTPMESADREKIIREVVNSPEMKAKIKRGIVHISTLFMPPMYGDRGSESGFYGVIVGKDTVLCDWDELVKLRNWKQIVGMEKLNPNESGAQRVPMGLPRFAVSYDDETHVAALVFEGAPFNTNDVLIPRTSVLDSHTPIFSLFPNGAQQSISPRGANAWTERQWIMQNGGMEDYMPGTSGLAVGYNVPDTAHILTGLPVITADGKIVALLQGRAYGRLVDAELISRLHKMGATDLKNK